MKCGKQNNILKIPRGNDFKIRISPQRIAPRQGENASFVPVVGLKVVITRQSGENIQADYVLTGDGDVIISILSTLKSGTYGLELTGTYNEDEWRWADCSLFQIVDCNPSSNVQALESFAADTYDIYDLPIPSLEEETLAFQTNGNSWISGGTLYIMGAENADGSGFISRVVVMDNHGNVMGDAVLATADRDTAIAEHNASHEAHPYIRSLIEQKGRVEDVRVNGDSVVDGKVARIIIPVKVSDLDPEGEYAKKTWVDALVDGSKVKSATAEFTVDETGVQHAIISLLGNTLHFVFYNLKGETGEKGDTVVLDPEHVQYYTLYNETGSNTDGAMTQAAVTRELEKLKPSDQRHTASEEAVAITPNVLHWWEEPMASITVTLGNATVADEFMMQFTCPAGAATALTITPAVRWVEEPEFKAGCTYQLSIVNGLAVCAEWEQEEEEEP